MVIWYFYPHPVTPYCNIAQWFPMASWVKSMHLSPASSTLTSPTSSWCAKIFSWALQSKHISHYHFLTRHSTPLMIHPPSLSSRPSSKHIASRRYSPHSSTPPCLPYSPTSPPAVISLYHSQTSLILHQLSIPVNEKKNQIWRMWHLQYFLSACIHPNCLLLEYYQMAARPGLLY